MADPKQVVFPIGAAVCVLALLYKLWDLRLGRRDPSLIALLVTFFCKGISFALGTPAVSAWVDEQIGVPDIAILINHLLGGVVASTAMLVAAVFWVHPTQQARPRAGIYMAAASVFALALIVLWIADFTPGHARATHYLVQHADRPLGAAYLLVYVTAFGAEMIEVVRLSVRYARQSSQVWLRRGLRVAAAGAAAYLVFCLHRAIAILAVHLGLRPLDWEFVTSLSTGIGVILFAAGLTMPSWGPRLSALHALVKEYLACAQLYPLWRALLQAAPEIALTHSMPRTRLADWLTLRDVSYRLYRRVIEIQDGRHALRAYLPLHPPVQAEGHGLSAERWLAAVEASRLKAAITAKACSERPRLGEGDELTAPCGDDYDDEVRWLVDLARAFNT
ncbi:MULTISPECIES: MAB_1171c family putative transporter [unclassified Nocardia]|uniref:MAB_1171c family putative transporter n=1 Tax=unclassified Nocardia TaxID=2637762 RepID=UPI001CE433F2|nr:MULTISPECIES: MAB_1171c family putative transporter [unclassified Nocardia]